MLSPNKLVPHMFLVLGKRKLEMCWPVSMCIVIVVRHEAAPVFPLPHGAVVYRRLFCRSLVPEEVWDPVRPKLCPTVWFTVVSTDFSCRCTGSGKEKCQYFISA